MKNISIKLFVLILSIISISLFGQKLNKYEYNHLKNFGKLQKVKIKDIHCKGKGTPYAFFDYYLNGKQCTSDLDSKSYNIGDSATIIFSTNKPYIIKWADDFSFEK
ncbi:MAG TPA: hypothetical protein VF411_00240 [Bacteroidia bacterium]